MVCEVCGDVMRCCIETHTERTVGSKVLEDFSTEQREKFLKFTCGENENFAAATHSCWCNLNVGTSKLPVNDAGFGASYTEGKWMKVALLPVFEYYTLCLLQMLI